MRLNLYLFIDLKDGLTLPCKADDYLKKHMASGEGSTDGYHSHRQSTV
jgi:hypothetical protein